MVPPDAFLDVKRMAGEFGEKQFADQLLRLNIDLQFDVMRCHGVDALALLEILAKQLSRFARGIFSRIEITLHQRITSHKEHQVHSGNRIPMELQILCVILSTAKDFTYLPWLRLMDLRNPRSDCEVPCRL